MSVLMIPGFGFITEVEQAWMENPCDETASKFTKASLENLILLERRQARMDMAARIQKTLPSGG